MTIYGLQGHFSIVRCLYLSQYTQTQDFSAGCCDAIWDCAVTACAIFPRRRRTLKRSSENASFDARMLATHQDSSSRWPFMEIISQIAESFSLKDVIQSNAAIMSGSNIALSPREERIGKSQIFAGAILRDGVRGQQSCRAPSPIVNA
jgi:hypothetical protein